MKTYSDFLVVLNKSADISDDPLIFLSKDLESELNCLSDFGIVYEKQREGISIDFSAQKFRIYKTKKDCLNRLEIDFFSADILVVEENLIFSASKGLQGGFFENQFFWHKLIQFLNERSIFSYDDPLRKVLIFLSEKHGKVEVGYKIRDVVVYYDSSFNMKNSFDSLVKKIDGSEEFGSFFRDSFISVAKELPDVNSRFTESLTSFDKIIESAVRDFELYKNKFSFEDFRNNLEKEKEKYFKEYQSNLSDFLAKIAAMPIQFGVYLYLILRFQSDFVPLLFVVVLIFSWSVFSYKSIVHIIINILYLKEKFQIYFEQIVIKSGMTKDEADSNRNEVCGQFDRVIRLVSAYRTSIVIFTVCSIIFCLSFLLKFPDVGNFLSIVNGFFDRISNGLLHLKSVIDNWVR